MGKRENGKVRDTDLLIFSDLLHVGEAEIGIDKDGKIKFPKNRQRMCEDNHKETPVKAASLEELLEEWKADTSGHDEKYWPEFERLLEERKASLDKDE